MAEVHRKSANVTKIRKCRIVGPVEITFELVFEVQLSVFKAKERGKQRRTVHGEKGVDIAHSENKGWSVTGLGQRGSSQKWIWKGSLEGSWEGLHWPGKGTGHEPRYEPRLPKMCSMNQRLHRTLEGVTKPSSENTAGLLRAFTTFIHTGIYERRYKRYAISQIF